MKKLIVLLLSVLQTITQADPAATHGMLIFGKEKIYLSHLPMFHNPHDYQVIVEVALPPAIKNAFVDDMAQHPASPLYTLVPGKFVLPRMIEHPTPFPATIFRGHFERGGVPILGDTTVEIKRVIHFRKFDPAAVQPDRLQYLVFGTPPETYLAHFITARPDFDQVLAMTVTGDPMGNGERLQFPAFANGSPLKEKTTAKAVRIGMPGERQVTVRTQIYLEFDDLQ